MGDSALFGVTARRRTDGSAGVGKAEPSMSKGVIASGDEALYRSGQRGRNRITLYRANATG